LVNKNKGIINGEIEISKHENTTLTSDAISHAYFIKDDKKKIDYLESVVSKQLELYNWFEAKVSTLATINTILLGAATLFLV